MKRFKPYLFRFKKECVSPSRAASDDEDRYDHSLDMMMTFENGKWIPVLDAEEPKPRTKKCDVEKGEDQKDSLMWR